MVYTEIDSARSGAQASSFTDFSVDAKELDGPSGAKETEYSITRAAEFLGFYQTIPELRIAIDTKAAWVIGKGITTPELTQLFLDTLTGFGTDTFNTILENMARQYQIYGDAFCEIIWQGDQMINLKPLNPAKIKIVADSKGILSRYEVSTGDKPIKIPPENMFHLTRNRIGDEIHGSSIIPSVEGIIQMRNQAMTDYDKLLHRNVYPVRIWHLDTDIPSKINAFKAKVAAAKGEAEDIFIPKGAVETELASVPVNATMNPMQWIQLLNSYFYQAVGVPQIVIGGAQELTQTAAQIAYLAFEQCVEEAQLYFEEQVLAQLNLEINLEFPASLQQSLLSDNRKDGSQEQQLNKPSTIQPTGVE